MTQINTSVAELQEANKEVLLGKRKLNCLSCGQGDKLNQVLGHDGQMYRSGKGEEAAYTKGVTSFQTTGQTIRESMHVTSDNQKTEKLVETHAS